MSRGRMMSITNFIGAMALILAMGLGAGDAVRADTFPPAPPVKDVAGVPPLAERARTLLSTQCASCHKGGVPGSSGSAFDASDLTLDDLAADPGLVRPGFAEASPLFQVLLSRHRPTDLGPGGLSGTELLIMRDWIESLSKDGACTAAARPQGLPKGSADRLLVTLRHLAGGCIPAGRTAEYRALADEIFAALSRHAVEVRSDDPNGLSFEIDVTRLDRLTGADLEALRAMMTGGPVPLDALAAFVIDRGLSVRKDVRQRVSAFARLWTRDVDLARAASDLGMTGDALTGKLRTVSGDAAPLAQRLLQGALPRPRWEALKKALAGEAQAVALTASETAIEVALLTDTPKAKSGDLLSLRAIASTACHLTIVSIDTGGRALVLYPNDIEENNLIGAGATITIPGPQAGYQVRFDRPGTETFVALCQRSKTMLEGVKVDYEKQRFPVLGDWRGFITVMDQQQARLEKDKQPRETRRSRRRGRDRGAETKVAPPPVDPKSNIEGWAAIRVTVE